LRQRLHDLHVQRRLSRADRLEVRALLGVWLDADFVRTFRIGYLASRRPSASGKSRRPYFGIETSRGAARIPWKALNSGTALLVALYPVMGPHALVGRIITQSSELIDLIVRASEDTEGPWPIRR
jgi:hypothetical protein